MQKLLLDQIILDHIARHVDAKNWAEIDLVAKRVLSGELAALPNSHPLRVLVGTIQFIATVLSSPHKDDAFYLSLQKEYASPGEQELIISAIVSSLVGHDPKGLLFAADRISQAWPGYDASLFPSLFFELARHNGQSSSVKEFEDTSYSTWYRAVRHLSELRLDRTASLLNTSMRLYKQYGYIGDAAWLHTDLVVDCLLRGDPTTAYEYLNEQVRYVRDVNGDGTECWDDPLWKFVFASRQFIDFFLSKNPLAFKAGVDCFSYQWSTYGETYYIAIFNNLRRLVLTEVTSGFYMDAHETLYATWGSSTRLFFLNAGIDRLHVSLSEVRARLKYLGASKQWAVCFLDEVLFRFVVEGDIDNQWLANGELELCDHLCHELTNEVINVRLSRTVEERLEAVSAYIAKRERYGAPEIVSTYAAIRTYVADSTSKRRRVAAKTRTRLDMTLMGQDLYANGILLWQDCPTSVQGILSILGAVFLEARGKGVRVPAVSSAELALRTGKTAGAVAQLLRRLRRQVEAVLQEHWGETGAEFGRIVEGRGGYRFSEDLIFGWHVVPAASLAGEMTKAASDSDHERSQKRTRLQVIK